MINSRFSLLTAIAILCCTTFLSAKQVPEQQARDYAKTVFAVKASHQLKSMADIKVTDAYTRTTLDGESSYYIFNFEPKGFVIISAQDVYSPVLAFSDESQINLDNEVYGESLFNTLGRHEVQIEHLRRTGVEASKKVQDEWAALAALRPTDYLSKDPDGTVVSPLTTTLWNQGEFYNDFTPKDADPEAIAGGTYCGCVPVAMAQLIKFHDYPPQGNLSITYDDPQYGTLSADFCNTSYNWSNMPDALTGPNDDVAQLIYQTGAATRTSFSTVYSETFISYVREALVHYFNYDEAASWFYDADGEFARVAIDDLNQGRPLIATGVAPNFGGTHSWVVDGYGYFLDPDPNQPNEFFHFNWGWGGDNNGWFLDTDTTWEPVPGEVGTQVITFYYDRYVVHNIFPADSNCAAPSNTDRNSTYYTSGVANTAAFLHYFEPTLQEDQEVSYRYRKVGDTEWTLSPSTMAYFFRASGLEPGTDYEFQVRRKCCGENWSSYSESAEFTTTGMSTSSACNTFINSSLSTSNITETSTYLYTSQPYGQVVNQFRYRFAGSPIWNFSDLSTNYFRFIDGLEAATDYEFEVRHQCEQGIWTEFSSAGSFRTDGSEGCSTVYELSLFTSGALENNAYVYTSQPYGKVNNQFRYRPSGASEWTMSSISDNYYRYLSGLAAGTEYEFQVAHLCAAGVWTDWSFVSTFTTKGGTTAGACAAIDGDRLYNSSISRSAAYMYTPQPFGNVANQFRYRPVGATTWEETGVSTLYYRYTTGLQSDTEYEFQVIHECNIGQWTAWSASKTFRTLSGFGGGNEVGLRAQPLPPYESTLFRESMLEQTSLVVYPNPVTDLLTFKTSVAFEEGNNLELIDLQGKTILRRRLAVGSHKVELNVTQLEAGIYFIKYDNGYELHLKKFVKN